jgi:hypothetical protein
MAILACPLKDGWRDASAAISVSWPVHKPIMLAGGIATPGRIIRRQWRVVWRGNYAGQLGD